MIGRSTFEWSSSKALLPGLFWLWFGWFLPLQAFSQHFLEGHWEGTLTEYDSTGNKTSFRINLFLEKDGKELSGRVFVHLAPGEMIVTKVFGYLYDDRSIYLSDQQERIADKAMLPDFFRKYQLLSNRSIWKTTLEGYWQEIVSGDPMDRKRKLGRMELKKMDNSKV